ncbi:MAG: WD40/YVTN/BNR-like repeat-containing protein [Sinimarinibacterium flocculans]|uniref:WD40/YVTN/BNR-like repeat-containing protein n=1 Tax=Sinimarinibacterium flocculans TaxID=985250 RepID=UPI002EC98786|nr:YCF48-related protein [Pseudomonadota bacterium]
MRRSAHSVGAVAAAFLLLQPPAVAAQGAADDDARQPRPALMAPRAASALLLDAVKAGERWVVAGQRGNILLSDDASAWQQVPVPVDATLTRLHFLDGQRGWAVGYDGTLLGTVDGGREWTLLQFDPQWARPYYDLHFFDADNGLLAGANGALLATTDGGRTWTANESETFEDQQNLYRLVALGDGSLLIAGERGFLARSKDRGASWQRLRSPYTGSFFGALPTGDKGVLIFGLRGNAFHSADIDLAEALDAEALQALRDAELDPDAASGGASPVSEVAGWRALDSAQVESLFDATVTADGRVVLVGMNGHVMQADLDSGRLTRLPVAPDNNMNAVVAAGDELIVVGTAGAQRIALP